MMQELPEKILIVDDEQDIIEFINYSLKKKGYITETAVNGAEAVYKAKQFKPDLILLDMMMPVKDGMQTLKELRIMPDFEKIPIVFLTAMKDEQSEISGLVGGADDYIAKPIKPELLATRVAAVLRRMKKDREQDEKIVIGDLEINQTKFSVYLKGVEVILAKKEFELLLLLASKPGRVFLRNEILQRVWGSEVIVGDRTIDVHIRKIRQKTGIDLITTVKGVGYKFDMSAT
jgi:two-component system alkaline phosphatase synthesis response regulator PhoP